MADDDDRLLAELGQAMRAAQDVPARFIDIGKAAFTWHNVDAELAELIHDSAEQPTGPMAGTRTDPSAVRALTFVAGQITIELEVTADAMQGQVVPALSGHIELQLRDGSTNTTQVDDLGWFLFSPPPTVMFRLHLRDADGRNIITAWTGS